MTKPVVSQPSKFRFAAFAVVLLLVSGLVVALFDEARAASIEITTPGTVSGTATFTADITVPNGQKLPIASAAAIIETRTSGVTVKTTAENPDIVAIAECDAPILGCPTPIPLDAAETIGTAITAISLENIYVSEVGSGYTVNARNEAASAYFSDCNPTCSIFHEGGYGYATGVGYGYGDVLNSATAYTANSGYGYGYTGEDLILRFQITVNAGALSAGTYWFTFEVDSGSATMGTLSSIATPFTAGSAGGGGGGPGGGPGGGTGGAITVTATSVTPPAGATAAFRATGVTQTAGNTVTINTGSDFVGQVVFTPSTDLNGATIDVVHYPASNPPDGVGNVPPGLDVVGFVQITVSSGGTSHTITIAVTVPPGQAEGKDPTKAVLIKWSDADNRWISKGRITLTQNADGSLSGTGTSDCCSDFAVAFDEQDPEITLDVPSGTLTGPQTITAEASDNLQVAKVEFYVDDDLVATDDSEPFTYSLNTAAYSNGDHEIRAVAYDVVDNMAEAMTTSSFDNADAPPGPGPGPGGDDDDDGLPWGMILIILVVLALIGGAGYYFYQQSQKK